MLDMIIYGLFGDSEKTGYLLHRISASDKSKYLNFTLDPAVRLRPEPTAAYHFRRAACLARAKDTVGSAREERLARHLKPATEAETRRLIGTTPLAQVKTLLDALIAERASGASRRRWWDAMREDGA